MNNTIFKLLKDIKTLQFENNSLKEELQKLQEVTKKQLKTAEDKDLKEYNIKPIPEGYIDPTLTDACATRTYDKPLSLVDGKQITEIICDID